jgi:hypothetical protein
MKPDSNIDNLALAWIELHTVPVGSERHDELFWSYETADDLSRHHPDECLEFILDVLSKSQTPITLQNLSAGPLEDLLARNGADVIDQVESRAKADARFAKLLGGVWQNMMSSDIWERVTQVWDRRGWDGIPE